MKDGPNKGWWDGPDYGQFYETGFRPLNGEGSYHTPFDGNSFLHAPGAPITPSKGDGTIDCGSDVNGNGADNSDCSWVDGSAIVEKQRLGALTRFALLIQPPTASDQDRITSPMERSWDHDALWRTPIIVHS